MATRTSLPMEKRVKAKMMLKARPEDMKMVKAKIDGGRRNLVTPMEGTTKRNVKTLGL